MEAEFEVEEQPTYDEVSTTKEQTAVTEICHTTEEPWISVKMSLDYEEVYSDRGTGAQMDLSVWKPVPPSGYKNLGYIFTSTRSKPTFRTPVVKELREGNLCWPVGWSFHWNDRGTGAPHDGSIWSPLAPSGFQAIGSVAKHMSNANAPTNWDFDSIVCIPDEVVCKTTVSHLIWKDSGSGGKFDGSVWAVHGSDFAKGGKDYGQPDCIVYALDLNSQRIRKDF